MVSTMGSRDGRWSAVINRVGMHVTLTQDGHPLGLQLYSSDDLMHLRNILWKGWDILGSYNGTPDICSEFATRVEAFNIANGDFRLVKRYRYAAVELTCGDEILGLYSRGAELRDLSYFIKDVATELDKAKRDIELKDGEEHA